MNDWSADMAQICKGAVVYVLADNDEPGRRVADTIQSNLQGIAEKAKVIVPVPDIPKADISDYFAAGHSKAEFESLLQQDFFVCGGTVYIYDGGYFKADVSGARLKTMIGKLIYPQFIKSSTLKRIYDRSLCDMFLEVSFEELNRYPAHWI